jgi:hypothetical protein
LGRINAGRLVLGAIVAGFVLNAADVLIQTVLMVQESQVMRQRLNLNPEAVEGTSTMVSFIVANFIMGFVMLFTYAGFRPRFGPGPMTATLAALVLFFSIAPVMFGFMMMGIFAPNAYMKSTLLYFVTFIAASLAGASVYKED